MRRRCDNNDRLINLIALGTPDAAFSDGLHELHRAHGLPELGHDPALPEHGTEHGFAAVDKEFRLLSANHCVRVLVYFDSLIEQFLVIIRFGAFLM